VVVGLADSWTCHRPPLPKPRYQVPKLQREAHAENALQSDTTDSNHGVAAATNLDRTVSAMATVRTTALALQLAARAEGCTAQQLSEKAGVSLRVAQRVLKELLGDHGTLGKMTRERPSSPAVQSPGIMPCCRWDESAGFCRFAACL
jgi:ribosomal protein S25